MKSSETPPAHPLAEFEFRLRTLLSAKLYALAWVNPTAETLLAVFEHLRTLQHILQGYLPRRVVDAPPQLGEMRYDWQEGTLMFTDLAGFTPLMAAYTSQGREGAQTILRVLNGYFTEMLDIIGKSGGSLLEFTGDAMLVHFPRKRHGNDTAMAVRAGLRMQRVMAQLGTIETPLGQRTLGMRVGIHSGRFLEADIGTPLRMQHVLLGKAVLQAKNAEGSGAIGRVCVTTDAGRQLGDELRCEPHTPGYALVVDDLTDVELGEYELTLSKRRSSRTLLLDRSRDGLIAALTELVEYLERLAGFLPRPILNLLVEHAAQRRIPADFPTPTVIFLNLLGLPEALDLAAPGAERPIVEHFAQAFALINAAVEKRGGVLNRVTCHLAGPDIVICFGTPNAHTNDPQRAAETVLEIRDMLTSLPPIVVGSQTIRLTCQIGMNYGAIFTGELGEPRGRRECTIQGDVVNTAARLMGRAAENQILLTEALHTHLARDFTCEALGAVALKGKTAPVPLFALHSQPA